MANGSKLAQLFQLLLLALVEGAVEVLLAGRSRWNVCRLLENLLAPVELLSFHPLEGVSALDSIPIDRGRFPADHRALTVLIKVVLQSWEYLVRAEI